MVVLYVVLGLLGLLLLLLGIACLRAVAIQNRTPLGAPRVPNAEAAQRGAESLSAMLRCATVNGPNVAPDETAQAFAALRGVLEERYPLLHKHTRRTLLGDAVIWKWPGADSARGAIVLMAHSDVVPATGEWQHEPFSGDIADGRVWGRGAVDDKGELCAILEAAERLLGEGFTSACDVYILSSNNEETMGDGAPKALAWFKEQGVRIDIVSDEGGAVLKAPMAGLSGYFAMLGIVEKGYANVRFTAKSKGGHASTPPKNTPLARLAAFVQHMEKRPPFKRAFSKPVRDMFGTLAPYMSFPYRLLLGNLWLFGPLLKRVLGAISPQAGAMLQTTCVFTMAEGSAAANVIPETASVTANLRFIMHQPMEPSLQAVRAVAEQYDLEMEVLYAHDVTPFVDIESENYRYMVRCVREVFPEAGVTPYIMVGGTDARHFAQESPCTVRFAPLIMDSQQLGSMHGLDENVHIDALARGAEFFYTVLKNYK